MADFEGGVAIVNDLGLDILSLRAADVDTDGDPQNLMLGTQYAVLNGVQVEQYANQDFEFFDTETEQACHLGGFAIRFFSPNSEVTSQPKMHK